MTDNNKLEYMREYMKEYQKKAKMCECCNRLIKFAGWYKHIRTPKHTKNDKLHEPKVIMREEELKQLNDKIKQLEDTIEQHLKPKKQVTFKDNKDNEDNKDLKT